MARIRTVKPEIWTSEQFMELSPTARLMFIGMFNFADDRGVLKFSPKTIKGNIFPADDINANTILGLVAELIKNGLVGVFESQGIEYLHILTFLKHQRIDKPNPKHPKPPTNPAGYVEWSGNPLGTHGDLFPEESPAEGNGRESKGMEGKGGDARAKDAPPPTPKGSRLSETWKPDDPEIAYAKKLGLTDHEIEIVAEKFVRWWTGPDAKAPMKKDWHRTWCNWLDEDAPKVISRRPRTSGANGTTGIHPDSERNSWKWRYENFRKTTRWRENLWGPPPGTRGCQCPPDVIAEVDKAIEPRE